MKTVLIGYAMLVGGSAIAVLNIVEWLRWRTGQPPFLKGRKGTEFAERDPKSSMGRIIEGMELIGWTVLGLFLGLVGLGIVTGL